jgi:hypothetical protein
MKKLFVINVLIFSGLAGFSQNLTNVYQGNQNQVLTQQSSQINYLGNVQVQTNSRGNRGRSSALSNFQSTNPQKVVTTNKQVKTNVSRGANVNVNNQVNIETNPNINDNVINDNVGSNPSFINTNPQVQVNNQPKTVVNQPMVVQESHGSDFKQIGLSGRDYSGGGKLKKGQKNFYKQEKTKVKHKKRPGYKKVKYHTAKCASW